MDSETEAIHVMFYIEPYVSLLKLPQNPGKLIVCKDIHLRAGPSSLNHMPPDGGYHLETKKIIMILPDYREVARGIYTEHFFMLVYL